MFEKPANEFVARFIGGHNVMTAGGEALACVRTNAAGASGDGRHLMAEVVDAEYQGPIVKVSLMGPDRQTLAALIPDHKFFSAPPAIGDRVTLSWSPEDEWRCKPLPRPDRFDPLDIQAG